MCVILCFTRRDQRALCKTVTVVTGTVQTVQGREGILWIREEGCAACVALQVCVSLLWSWNTEQSGELSGTDGGQERSPRP